MATIKSTDENFDSLLKENKILWGECLSGALYWNDFINLSKECGFKDVRLVKYNRITQNRIKFIDMNTYESDLEDVFLELTK